MPYKQKKIILISPRDTFIPFDYRQNPKRALDSLWGNAGNMVFFFALQKMTLDLDITVDVKSREWVTAHSERVNEEYSACFTSPANLLGIGWQQEEMKVWEILVNKLAIPFHVIGLGAQSDMNYDLEFIKVIQKQGYRLIRSILNLGGNIGVRGYFTAEVLKRLGFSDQDFSVIGCPSLFMDGASLQINKPAITKEQLKPLFNGRRFWYDANLQQHFYINRSSVYICQDRLYKLLYPFEKHGRNEFEMMQGSLFRDLYKDNRVRLYCDFLAWKNALVEGQFNFSVGDRIHGNIVALLAGIPCHVEIIDSRVREIAEYYGIPHSSFSDSNIDLFELYQISDYSEFNNNFPERYSAFKLFLEKCRLPCHNNLEYIKRQLERMRFVAPPTDIPLSLIEDALPHAVAAMKRLKRKKSWWYKLVHFYWLRKKN